MSKKSRPIIFYGPSQNPRCNAPPRSAQAKKPAFLISPMIHRGTVGLLPRRCQEGKKRRSSTGSSFQFNWLGRGQQSKKNQGGAGGEGGRCTNQGQPPLLLPSRSALQKGPEKGVWCPLTSWVTNPFLYDNLEPVQRASLTIMC